MTQTHLLPQLRNPPDPLPVNSLWVREIADYMALAIRTHRRALTVERAMSEMGLRASAPDVAPAVAHELLARGFVIVGSAISSRPSRKGARIAIWGGKREAKG